MKISQIIERLEDPNKEAHKNEVLGWLKDVSPERDLITVDKMRMGDTFFWKLVGGKARPWVTLWVRKGLVGAASLTHSNLECSYACQDRFWSSGNFIGPTLTIFREDLVKSQIYFPYTNRKHLKEVKDSIRLLWG